MIITSSGGVFYCCAVCLVTQSFPTLGDPTDCSPPGSFVHGILQAGILEWVAMPSSRRSSQPGINLPNPGLLHLPSEPPGKGILPGQILKLIRTRNSFLCLFHFLPSWNRNVYNYYHMCYMNLELGNAPTSPCYPILMLLMIALCIINCLICFVSFQVNKLQHAVPVQQRYKTTADHGESHLPLDGHRCKDSEA